MANLGVEFMALVQDSRTQRGMKLSFINNSSAFNINKLIPSVQHPVIAWTMLKGKSYVPLTSCSWHMKLQEIEDSTWLKRKKINEVMANNNTTLPFYWLLQRWKNRFEGDCPKSCDAVNFRYYILLWIYHSFPVPEPHTLKNESNTLFLQVVNLRCQGEESQPCASFEHASWAFQLGMRKGKTDSWYLWTWTN